MIGSRFVLTKNAPGMRNGVRNGVIVGESRDKVAWWLIFDGGTKKARYCYHKSFVKIEGKASAK